MKGGKMKKNDILKEANVLLIITFLFLSTVAVNGNIQINQIFISESEVINPEYMQDEEYLYYYDPDTAFIHGIGLLGGAQPYEWKTAIRLTQVELAPYPNWNLIGVKVLHYEDEYQHWGEIEIYSEGNDTSPGELITSEPYYFDDIDWFRINLSTAVPIDGNSDIWIAVTWNTTDHDDPAAADDGPAVDGKGDWILLPGEDWEELQEYYWLDYNWFIEGIVKENQPPYLPTNPEPEDGASDVDIDIVLNWTGGDPDGNPVTYDVYFGTTSPPSKMISNHTEETYNLGTLNYSTTYYWKIVAWDVIGAQSEGPIWEFTTRDPIPDVECDGTLIWTDVSTEEIVEGNFTIKNIGEPTSLLDWEIESYPDWGTWTFDPGSGDDLKPSDGPVTVNVTVVAPEEKNTQFTGNVTIVNKENTSDFCTIDVSISTPKNKPFIFINNLLDWLFERFPNAFPILRHLIELL